MAFSATIRGQGYNGQLRTYYGQWSGSAGDAAGTISVGGYYLGSLWFRNDSSQPTSQIFPKVEWDQNVPGTLTIENQDNVTNGGFIIFTIGS